MRSSLRVQRLLWLVIVIIFLFATGCTNEKVNESAEVPVDEPEKVPAPLDEQESPTREEKEPEVENEEETISYVLNKTTYQNGNLTIHYPQLSGMKNKTIEKQTNELLEIEVQQFVNQYEDDEATLDMEYTVMDTQDTLSVVYTGYYSVEGGMYPSHLLFTTNINLYSGEKIGLSDIVTIDDHFIKRFKAAPYIDRENPQASNKELTDEVKKHLNRMDQSELITALQQVDLPTMKDNPYGVYSYFHNQSLYISIQVPHVIGDHAEFKLEME